MKSYYVTIQMKPLQQYFHMALFILVCSSNFWVCGWNPMVWPFKWNLFSSTFTWHYLFSNLVQTFESVDESTRHVDIIQNCNNDYIYSLLPLDYLYSNTDFGAQICSSTIFFKHALINIFLPLLRAWQKYQHLFEVKFLQQQSQQL